MADKNQNPDNLQAESLEVPQSGPVVEPSSGKSSVNETQAEKKEQPVETRRASLAERLKGWQHAYLAVFFILIIMAAVAGFLVFRSSDSDKSRKSSSSLTSDQLAELQGNVTTVGDPKQILSIQGSTLFEGPVLLKKDLDVAGVVKLGGGLTSESLVVNSKASFGKLQVNDNLSVAKNTTLSGQLSVQGNINVAGGASFGGNLTTNRLSVSDLQLNSNLTINRHIITSGSQPSRSGGTALGSGGTVSISGSDTAGTISIHTGGAAPAGTFVNVVFANAFSSVPHVVVTPVGSAAAGLNYYVSRTAAGFSLATASNPPDGASFSFDYIVIQ